MNNLSDSAPPSRRCHSVRNRLPIVSTLGLTRSKGNVSHAGNTSTRCSPTKMAKSCANRSASAEVGTATTIGRRSESSASADSAMARAGSGIATTPARSPITDTNASSSTMRSTRCESGAFMTPR